MEEDQIPHHPHRLPFTNDPHRRSKTEKLIQSIDYLIRKFGLKLRRSAKCKHYGTCFSSTLVNSIKIGPLVYAFKVAF